ncbi:MAG: hypothetical protein ABI680_10180, partial [Chthoniobacteraceae bacterium]
MNLNRHWIAISIAGFCAATIVAQGQDESAPAAAESAPAEAEPAAEPAPAPAPAPESEPEPAPSEGSVFSSESGASSSFSSSVFSASPDNTAEAPGAGGVVPEAAPSYSLPGLYGEGTQTFVPGQGRLAHPLFETNISLSIGYDDNIFLTPTDGASFITGITPILVDPGSLGGEPIYELREVFEGGTIVLDYVQVGVTEPSPPVFETEVTTIQPAPRVGSFLSRANFGLETTIATRRTLFVMDASAGALYYWNRPGDPWEPTGSISATYLYRLSPRWQATASLSSAYLEQPDYTRIDTPNRPNLGGYFYNASRVNLSYRSTPRLSFTGSGSYNFLRYTEPIQEQSNYDAVTVGLQASYLMSPRYSVLAEYRHNMVSYPLSELRNSFTEFLIVGTEFTLNRRLTGSLRLGESIRTFETGGGSASSPYMEASLKYRTSPRSQLQFNSRFGFEEPPGPDQERQVLRTGIQYQYSFTPRL